MFRKWIGGLALVAIAFALLNLFSCAHSQELVSIQVTPSTENIGSSTIPVNFDAGAQVQLRALGSYIHPPVTKDLTNLVAWSSNDTQMFTVNSTGLLTATGSACGGTVVSATFTTNSSAGGISSSGALITGTMQANVICFTGSGSGGGPLLTVQFAAGSNAGSVSSDPAGLGVCTNPGPCATDGYTSGTVVTLTATPISPSTTATWLTCPSANGDVCTVDLTQTTNLIVQFM